MIIKTYVCVKQRQAREQSWSSTLYSKKIISKFLKTNLINCHSDWEAKKLSQHQKHLHPVINEYMKQMSMRGGS